LDERYKQVPITVLAHGDKPLGYEPTKVKIAQKKNAKKNTIVVLGELRPEKGAGILKSIAPKLLETADIHVLGYGDNELDLPGNGLHVLKRYKESELGTILQAINPDLGLLLSTWPETYSYTLSELIQAQIPVVATNLGSFADRIKHGVTGYLCPARPQDVSAQIRKALDNPDELQQIRTNLKNVQLKSVGQMVEEYHQRLPVPPREPVRILPDFRLGPVTNQLPLDVPADFLPFGNYVDFSISYLREKHAELHKKSRIKGLIIRTVLTGFRVLRKIRRLTS
jgi:glycosyltransferase involved in cell wall biosynthesis